MPLLDLCNFLGLKDKAPLRSVPKISGSWWVSNITFDSHNSHILDLNKPSTAVSLVPQINLLTMWLLLLLKSEFFFKSSYDILLPWKLEWTENTIAVLWIHYLHFLRS